MIFFSSFTSSPGVETNSLGLILQRSLPIIHLVASQVDFAWSVDGDGEGPCAHVHGVDGEGGGGSGEPALDAGPVDGDVSRVTPLLPLAALGVDVLVQVGHHHKLL